MTESKATRNWHRSSITSIRAASGLTPEGLEVTGDELHVNLAPLSAPRRTRAIAGLCDELNATKTLYPGTQLTLVYTVKAGR